ncbi:MAG TPA: tetrahydrofolate dehydrogenase/cyclohydrolase catalytic domain-containing protein [Acidimicrobiales bacterium]
MTAQLLDGERLAQAIKMELAGRVARLTANGRTPGLGTLLVGENPSSARYVEMKIEECKEIGVKSFDVHLASSATQAEIEAVVDEFNANSDVHSILVQLPLPDGINEEEVLLRVNPAKDVDGLHPTNLGRLVMGAPGPLPCTPNGIVELLAAYEVPVEGKHVVIIGRGLTIGRPLALLMSMKRPHCNAAVTVVHTGVEDMAALTRSADVIVSAVGVPGIVTADMVKPGAAVVGAGTSFAGKKLLSDLADDVAEKAAWITPRLGGVGPMTRAMLLRNAVLAAEKVR